MKSVIDRAKYLLLILYVFPYLSLAGGDAHLTKIDTLTIQDDTFTFTATSPIKDKKWAYTNCRSIKVSGHYDHKKWNGYKGVPMSIDTHNESLKLLKTAYDTNKIIYFGSFGNGLKQNAPCSYLSKGLFSEGGATFSIFNPI